MRNSAPNDSSILRGNVPSEISWGRGTPVSFSNIRGGRSGEGNIDVDPWFADPDYWDA